MKKMILPDIVSVGVYHTRHYVKAEKMTPERRTAMFDWELSAEEGAKSIATCLAIVESAKTGVPVKPHYNF